MMKNMIKKLKKRIHAVSLRAIGSVMSLVMIAGILGVFCVGSTTGSGAYLYDEKKVYIDYYVAELVYDLSSNHMYTFYNENPTYSKEFSKMLGVLNTAVSQFDAGSMSLTGDGGLIQTVKTALKGYYPDSMIDELAAAWDTYGTSQYEYNDATRAVYNKYYHDYDFLFKIKNYLLTSVDPTKSIWYYYADDLLNTYFTEFVVQHDATGVSQSTMKIGVKLRGGTTYSSDSAGTYYDRYFNDMVNGFTMKFVNAGNVSLFLNYLINMKSAANAGTGVLGMILPYGMTFATLRENATYSGFYNTTTQKWDYRGLLAALMSSRDSEYTVSPSSYATLNYTTTETILREWNEYAVETYVSNERINDLGNYEVFPKDTQNAFTELDTSFIFWADYEQNAKHYKNYLPSESVEEWRTNEDYEMITYDFSIEVRSSLKNNNMSSYTTDEWNKIYNSKKIYNKFAGVSNFDVYGYAYFERDNANGTKDVIDASNFMRDGYIICKYSDPVGNEDADQINFLRYLRFDIRYRGYSTAYIRLRLIEQFTNHMGKIEAANQLRFALGDDWYDNRSNDLYFYSAKQYSSVDTNTMTTAGLPKYITIPVITGLAPGASGKPMSAAEIDPYLIEQTEMTLKLTFYLEAVQPNRTEEYWNKSESEIAAICTAP